MILQQKEEINKRNKVKENKPYVYQKMLNPTRKNKSVVKALL